MRIFLFFIIAFLSVCIGGFCEQVLPKTEAEAQFIRRIVACQKDKEPLLVRNQVKQFAQEYPESAYLDDLWVLLGDLEYSQECFEEALLAYNSIKNKKQQASTLVKRLEILHHLQKWNDLAVIAKIYIPKSSEEISFPRQEPFVFYYAEALHHQAQKHRQVNRKISDLSRQLDETAKRYYELLVNSTYREKAILRLAEIYMASGNEKRASELYLSLCNEKDSSFSKDDLLMQAALLQSKSHPEGAIRLYSQVIASGGRRAKQAIEEKMLLLFSLEKYDEIVQVQEEIKTAENPRVEFLFAKALCALDRFEEALQRIEPLLVYKEKLVLLTAIHCAQQIHDLEKVEKWVAIFENCFSYDSDYATALYYLYLSYKQEAHTEKATAALLHLIKLFPEHREKPTIHLEHAFLLYSQKRWVDCRLALRLFIGKFPHDDLCGQALSYLIAATFKEIEEEQTNDKKKILCQDLYKDVQLAINYEGERDTEQRRYFQLQLAKVHYLCEEYEKVIALLESLSSFDQNGYQIHLLLALSHRMVSPQLETFIVHAQNALKLQPEGRKDHELHHHLFSAFILLAKQQTSEKKQKIFLEEAAFHLFHASNKQELCTEPQLLWLGKYLYQQLTSRIYPGNLLSVQTEPDVVNYANMTLKTYQKIQNPTDEEIWRMCQLYGWLGDTTNQISLLEQLIKKETVYQAQGYAHLGIAQQAQGNLSKALRYYKESILLAKESQTFEIQTAKLQYARLSFPQLKKRSLSYPEVVKILGFLEQVKNQKKFAQEPLHLEASIDYALYRSSFEPEGEAEKKLIDLLCLAKEEFTQLEDINCKDYHEARKSMPDKEGLYQAYLLLMDAHIAQAEAKLALLEKKDTEQQFKRQLASDLFHKISEGKYAVSQYLKSQSSTYVNNWQN